MVDSPHIVNGDMSGSITPTSFVSTELVKTVSAHMSWTGTPTGTFQVWASNFASGANSVNVTALVSPAIAAPAGAAGQAFASLPEFGFKFVQVRYVVGSGTGVLNVQIVGKE